MKTERVHDEVSAVPALGLGKLYQRVGMRQQAREHLATAATMFGEMDMRSAPHAGA